MSLVFLAYANGRSEPLPSLSREEEQVYSLLSRRAARHDFSVHRDANATLPKVAEYLIRFREDLCVFAFSGHAGRDRLLLEDQAVQGEGIAGLLGQCPQLRLVALNGCSTRGQARRLMQLPNGPAVISTSAPVGDLAATQFAISFFQAFSEQHATVREAFDIGFSAARAAAREPISLPTGRTLALGVGEAEEPWWGLDVPPGRPQNLDWKLPEKKDGNSRLVDLLERKLSRLREQLLLIQGTDAAREFVLENQIGQAEEELSKLKG
ncbi:MAG: hypothetical protein H6558_15605 [Lewinellaceae bacterium]|nr:hypothetical protein [Lewinellaceae bacterium]MCB9291513.1 hypothetical protein [Lewinellaceae bacterium]